jgi:hypothetical protein
MEHTDAAWLAGFLDGEGSITLYRSRWKWKPDGPNTRRLPNHQREPERYRPLIAVSHTDMPTCAHVDDLLVRMGAKHYQLSDPKVVNPSRLGKRPQRHISVMSFVAARRVLEVVMPYLVTKQANAEALWRFIEIAQSRDPHLHYTDEQREIALFLRRHPMHGNPQPSQAGPASRWVAWKVQRLAGESQQ